METIVSKDNQRLREARKLFEDKSLRCETRRFPTEGLRLTAEAARLGLPLLSLFVSDEALRRYADGLDLLMPLSQAVYRLPDNLMAKLGDTKTPQGVVGIFAMPPEAQAPLTGSALVLCHLQEPGNVGAILRTAAAFGVPVVLTADCPDLYSAKVLRASMGGVFGGGWSTVESVEGYIAARRAKASPVLAAVLHPDSRRLHEAGLPGAAVLLGNEGSGLPDSYIALSDAGLYIPIRKEAESLNVAMAAGLIAYEMVRGGAL